MSARLLVDTHAVLWWLADDKRLAGHAGALIADPANVIAVSSASVWEIAIKTSLGKLRAPDSLPEAIEEAGFAAMPIESSHAWACRRLPLSTHADPFDRILAAQALVENFELVSADDAFDEYGIVRHWATSTG